MEIRILLEFHKRHKAEDKQEDLHHFYEVIGDLLQFQTIVIRHLDLEFQMPIL